MSVDFQLYIFWLFISYILVYFNSYTFNVVAILLILSTLSKMYYYYMVVPNSVWSVLPSTGFLIGDWLDDSKFPIEIVPYNVLYNNTLLRSPSFLLGCLLAFKQSTYDGSSKYSKKNYFMYHPIIFIGVNVIVLSLLNWCNLGVTNTTIKFQLCNPNQLFPLFEGTMRIILPLYLFYFSFTMKYYKFLHYSNQCYNNVIFNSFSKIHVIYYNRYLIELGKYTFSAYLFHVVGIGTVYLSLKSLSIQLTLSFQLFLFFISLFVTILLSILVHHYVELPIYIWLSTKYKIKNN